MKVVGEKGSVGTGVRGWEWGGELEDENEWDRKYGKEFKEGKKLNEGKEVGNIRSARY